MPFGVKPQCSACNLESAEVWHKNSKGQTICNDCHQKVIKSSKPETVKPIEKAPVPVVNTLINEAVNESIEYEESIVDENTDEFKAGPGTRSGALNVRGNGKSGSRKPGRGRSKKPGNYGKVSLFKGRGRRAVLKKPPVKAPNSVSTSVTRDYLFNRGMLFQVGDIVSVTDEDGSIYYAQIRGLLQDQYCEKSAGLTWLLPTQSSPPPEKEFDPLTYILGPEEELPRKLDYLEFVMHAPNEYYKLDENIRMHNEKEAGFIWTSMGAIKRTI